MLHFLAVDFGTHEVGLFTEEEFCEKWELSPADVKNATDSDNDVERAQQLADYCFCEIAWSRADAVDLIVDEIELLGIDTGDSETLRAMAEMLICIAENEWWDRVLDSNPGV